MAKSVVSAQQLAMFMTPREIEAKTQSTDAPFYGGVRQMRDIKGRENELTGLDESVKKEGVKKPVNLYHTSTAEGGHIELTDGNHRMTAALKHRPDDLIPVVHSDASDFRSNRHYIDPNENDWHIRKRVNLVDEEW